MKNRKQSIILQLVSSTEPMTASEIAKRLRVSPRTIKEDMIAVQSELKKVGATLIAKRNKGYSIQIDDADLFHPYIEQVNMKSSSFTNNGNISDAERFLYIARKLISVPAFVKIDDIADELFISRSTLRDDLKRVSEVLRSYHMTFDSRPGRGIRVYGAEYQIRMVMTDLFVYYFHKVILDETCIEYTRWFECEDLERQDIRHSFLHTLRKNNLLVFDNDTQRISRYLIVARNRHKAGYSIDLPGEWVEEIKSFYEYQVATEVFANLAKEFPGYDLPEHEIAFLAIWILCNRDMGDVEINAQRYPLFLEDAKRYAEQIFRDVQRIHGIDLKQSANANGLVNILIPNLARDRYGSIGANNINTIQRRMNLSPLPLEIARTMLDSLETKAGRKISPNTVVYQFSGFVYNVLNLVNYDIKKLNLLIVSTQGGKLFSDIAIQRIRLYFDPWIESCTKAVLFEIRGMDQNDYDAIVFNSPVDFIYNYSLPYANIHTALEPGQLQKFYNTILIHAYQIGHLLPDDSIIRVYNDFDYVSEEQFFQLIGTKHCEDEQSRQCLTQMFLHNEQIASYRSGEAVFLFGRQQWTQNEAVEVYILNKPGHWYGAEIRFILYCCINWQNDLKRMRAMENSLIQLDISRDWNCLFADNKPFEKLVYQSLQI